jgi:hypothetical protein
VTLTVAEIVSPGEIHVVVPATVTWSQWLLIAFQTFPGQAKLLEDGIKECTEDLAKNVDSTDDHFEGKCIGKDLYLARKQVQTEHHTAPAPGPEEEDTGLTAGEVAGITIGVIAFVGIVTTFAVYWFVKGRHAPAEEASF